MHMTNIISQYFGKLAKTEFPSFIQNIINGGYVKFLKLNMSEFRKPKYYKSLNDLFTRELAIPRQIDEDKGSVISPTDSFVTACGKLDQDKLLQIKGMEYNIDELLTQHVGKNIDRVYNGAFMNFYLSPRDYHRYHASCDCQITKLIHVPGKLYPVNIPYLNKEIDLFCQNERVILECLDNNGKLFYMVFVGALNVGQMVFEFESGVETNTDATEIRVYEYEQLSVSKGDCLGYFKMGSTVVMVWEEAAIKLQELTNQKVTFGQKINK